MKKSKAFMLAVCLIMAMFVLMIGLQFFGKAEGFPVGAFLTAIVSISTCYIGLEVANNGVRGKCFNEKIPQIDAEKEKCNDKS